MKTATFTLLLCGLALSLSPQTPSWAQGPKRSAEVCFDRERAAAQSGANADGLAQIKNECLQQVHSLDEFAIVARPACGAACSESYFQFLETFILSNASSYIVPGDSMEQVRQLGCQIRAIDSRVRYLESAMPAIRTQRDWDLLAQPAQCPGQTRTWEYVSKVHKFQEENQKFAAQLIAQSPPDTSAGAASQLIGGLQDLKRDFLPVFTPTLSALLDSALDYQKNLSLGEDLPEVRARAHLIVLFEDYSRSFCKPWESSKLASPLCGRVLAPIQFLRTKFPPDLEVRKAMEVRVIISTLETLKRHALIQDWAIYVEPVDSALRELVAYAVAGGDSAGSTIRGILKLAEVMDRKVGNQGMSPSEWMLRQMGSGDIDMKIAATETLKKIRLLTQEAKKDRNP